MRRDAAHNAAIYDRPQHKRSSQMAIEVLSIRTVHLECAGMARWKSQAQLPLKSSCDTLHYHISTAQKVYNALQNPALLQLLEQLKMSRFVALYTGAPQTP